jgi:hypothetical protein
VYGELFTPVTLTGVVPFVYVKFQGGVPVSVVVIVALEPAQIVELPLMAAVPVGLIVTTADPDKLSLIAKQPLPSLSESSVYDVVVVGLTVKVYGELVIPVTITGETPFKYLNLHGGVPVRETERLAELPLHIEGVPEIEALRAPTVTFTESKSRVAAFAVHPKLFESFKVKTLKTEVALIAGVVYM